MLKKKLLFFLFFLSFTFFVRAADRYWIFSGVGSSNWNNTANWSTASGGAGGASVPGAADVVFFDGNGTGDCNFDLSPTVSGANMVAAFPGTLTLLGNTFNITGTVDNTFAGGAVNEGIGVGSVVVNTTGLTTFSGTTFGPLVDITSGGILLNGSTFSKVSSFTKTGATNDASTGGNSFVGDATFENSGSGYFMLGNGTADVFSAEASITNSGTSDFYFAEAGAGHSVADSLLIFNFATGLGTADVYIANDASATLSVASGTTIRESGTAATSRIYVGYEGDIIFNGTVSASVSGSNVSEIYFNDQAGSVNAYNEDVSVSVVNLNADGIYFGFGGGAGTLAATKTITIPAGFNQYMGGPLYFRNFTQVGATAQSLEIDATATYIYNYDCDWGGDVDFIAPRIFTRGTTYNRTARLEKKGASADDNNVGGNVFSDDVTLVNSGSDYFMFGNSVLDTYSANVDIINSGTSDFHFAEAGAGHVIGGTLTVTNSATGAGPTDVYLANGASANLAVVEAVLDNLGSSNSLQIYLGLDGDVTVGGNLTSNNAGTGTLSEIRIAEGLTSSIVVNGTSNVNNAGGGTTKRTYVGYNGDINFNGQSTFSNQGTATTSEIRINDQPGSLNFFNHNIIVASGIGSDGILFGANGGAAGLTAARTISILFNTYAGGQLYFRNFSQLGPTAQTLSLEPTATYIYNYDCSWGGDVTFTAPRMITRGTTYDGTAELLKNGAGDDVSLGGNTFNDDATLSSFGTGYFMPASTVPNDFNGNVLYSRGAIDNLRPTDDCASTYAGDITVQTTGGLDFTFGASANGRVVMDGSTAQSINVIAISGTKPPFFRDLQTTNAVDDITLNTRININEELDLDAGHIISSSSNILSLINGAIVSSYSEAAFVDGPIERIGAGIFTFPVGKNDTALAPVSISPASNFNDTFTVEYFQQSPDIPGYTRTSKDLSLDNVSDCEYWIMDRSVGASDVSVTLSWEDRSCAIGSLAKVSVARWDGAQWRDHGNGGTTGNATAGTVVTDGDVTSFSPFTLSASFICNDIIGPSPTVTFNDTLLDTLEVAETEITTLLYAFPFTPGDSLAIISQSNPGLGVDSIVDDSTFYYAAGCGAGQDTVTVYLYNKFLTDTCDTLTVIITVIDTVSPTIACPANQTEIVDGSCQFTLIDYTPMGVVFSPDGCPITVTQSPPVGAVVTTDTTVWLYAADVNGNIDSCDFMVLLSDTLNPIASCKDTTVYLDASGNVVIDSSFVNDGSTDNCTVLTMSLSQSAFTCGDIGANAIRLYVTDSSGNIDSCDATVTVLDTLNPSPVCKDTTVYLDASGNVVIDSSFVNDGSTDNCTALTMSLSQSAFTCGDIGPNAIKLYVTDGSGNIDSCNATVTILDTLNPAPMCKDTTVYLDASGNVTIDSSFVNDGSTDNCTALTMSLSQSAFACGDIGPNVIKLYVTDGSGNVDSCNATVTVLDTLDPVVTCPGNQTAAVDPACQFTIIDYTGLGGATDNCSAVITQLPIPGTVVTGNTTIRLIATDPSSNTDTCSFLVTVTDVANPTALCKDTTVYLDALGSVTIDSSFVNDGSNDNCSFLTMSLSQSTFNCGDIGPNAVTLTVFDGSSNSDNCPATVTVLDTLAPVTICKDTTVYLDAAGNVVIDSSFVNDGSSDNCSPVTMSLSQSAFACGDVGPNVIKLYVTDALGNVDSCNATVTVLDTLDPVVTCPGTQSTVADLNCQYSILDYTGMGSATDNCSAVITQLPIPGTTITGNITAMLVATDPTGNTDTCSFLVTVSDFMNPTAICKDTTVYLDASGNVVIDSSFVNDGSTDNCTALTMSLSQSAFNCGDIGPNAITLTVFDGSSNSDNCPATVTVLDTLAPTMVCKDTTVYLDALGSVTIDSSFVDDGTSDNCTVLTMSMSQSVFTCADTGTNAITLYAVDISGNIDSCVSNVTILDTIRPVITCLGNQLVAGDSSCQFTLIDYAGLSSASDNCSVDTIIQSPAAGTILTDSATVTITAINPSGNVDVCSFLLTIEDTIDPIAVCQDITAYIDGTGNVIVNPGDIDGGSSDNCSVSTSINLSQTTFTCSDVGTNTVVVTVTDDFGNSNTCSVNVTVLDTINYCVVPSASFSASDSSICEGDCINFTATGSDASAWNWSFEGGTPPQSTDQNPGSICFTTSGNYTVELVTSNAFASDTSSITIVVNDLPIVDAGMDVSINIGASVSLNATGPVANYLWSPATGLSCSQCQNTVAMPDTTTNYTVTVLDSNGCSSSDVVMVSIDGDNVVFVPDAFSPNGDGQHDVLYVRGQNIGELEFFIYDRWGKKVFETSDPDIGWDGTFDGKELNKAVFVYYLNVTYADGSQETKKGDIILVK